MSELIITKPKKAASAVKLVFKILLFLSPVIVFTVSISVPMLITYFDWRNGLITYNRLEESFKLFFLFCLYLFDLPTIIITAVCLTLYLVNYKVRRLWSNVLFIIILVILYGYAINVWISFTRGVWSNTLIRAVSLSDYGLFILFLTVGILLMTTLIFFMTETIINMVKIINILRRQENYNQEQVRQIPAGEFVKVENGGENGA